VKITFDTNGNEKQKEVVRHWVDDSVSDIVYGGSKGSGKSYLGVSLIFGDALMYPGIHAFIARKKLNDLRKYTIPSIHEVFEHWGLDGKYFRFNAQDNFFTLYNGSKVFLLEAAYQPSDPQYYRFGSMQMTRGMLEEAGEFEEAAKNNLAASIGRWKNDLYNIPGKLLQTCNPAKNYLYRGYYKPFKDGTLDSWKRFVQALPEDNKMLAPGYLDHLRRTLSTNEKERLLKGNWEFDDDPATMCDYRNIIDIFTNQHVPEGPGYISADIARMGKDKTIIRVWSGWRCIKRVVLTKSTVTDTSARIRELANAYQIPMSRTIVDEDGVGGGVKDILNCSGFIAASLPLLTYERDLQGQTVRANFDMLKSQCAFKLAEIVNAAAIYDPQEGEVRDKITLELEQLKRKAVDSDMKQGIIKKEIMKEMLGHSPDDLDTYIMRAYFDVLLSTTPQGAPAMQVF
jgi:phage terminase large subunit